MHYYLRYLQPYPPADILHPTFPISQELGHCQLICCIGPLETRKKHLRLGAANSLRKSKYCQGTREMPLPPDFSSERSHVYVHRNLSIFIVLFKFLSIKILISHFYTCLNRSLLNIITTCQPSNKVVFKKFTTDTFVSPTLVTFALITWNVSFYLLDIFIHFYFLEWKYNCMVYQSWNTDEWFKKSEVKESNVSSSVVNWLMILACIFLIAYDKYF